MLRNSLFEAVKLTKNADFDKYKYVWYSIGFGAFKSFSLSDSSRFGENIVTCGANMNSSVHYDNRKRVIFIPGRGPTQRLSSITLTAKKEYAANFSEQQKEFRLRCLHYNGVNCYLFFNGVEIYQSKAKDSKINAASLELKKSLSWNYENDWITWICLWFFSWLWQYWCC